MRVKRNVLIMTKLGLLCLLAASGICYVSARGISTNNPKAINIILRDLPHNHFCQCTTANLCNPSIFIAEIVCPPLQGCCLHGQMIVQNGDIMPFERPDTIRPPLAIHIDRTPPNHSCQCDEYSKCKSRVFVENVKCKNHHYCCLIVGEELPVIDYPEVYREIYGIEEYAHLHQHI